MLQEKNLQECFSFTVLRYDKLILMYAVKNLKEKDVKKYEVIDARDT